MFSPKKFKAAREKAGLTQAALADAAGISSTVISNYENGNYRPMPETQAKLATPLGINVADLHDDGDESAAQETIALGTRTVVEILTKAKADLAAASGASVDRVNLDFSLSA